MRTDPGKGRPVNIRDPEFLTLHVIATLAANPSVPLGQGGFCGFRALCLQEKAAAGPGSFTSRMYRTPSKKSTEKELGLEHPHTEPRGLTRVLMYKCRPKTFRAKMWDQTGLIILKLNFLPSSFVVSDQTNPLGIRHKMQTTQMLLGREAATEGKSPPHLVRASFGYLSHPKPQPRYPHRSVWSPPNRTPVIHL